MKKISKYKLSILAITLLCVGAIAVVFGNSFAVQGGVAGIAWGLSVFILAYATNERNNKALADFDKECDEIVQDIMTNKENSDYFGLVDFDKINKERGSIIKKSKKQVHSCCILGAALIIGAILCIF